MTSIEIYRKLNPRSRRMGATAIIHSGGNRTVYGCVCGAEHSCSTSHRKAKHVQKFIHDHRGCLDAWVAKNAI